MYPYTEPDVITEPLVERVERAITEDYGYYFLGQRVYYDRPVKFEPLMSAPVWPGEPRKVLVFPSSHDLLTWKLKASIELEGGAE